MSDITLSSEQMRIVSTELDDVIMKLMQIECQVVMMGGMPIGDPVEGVKLIIEQRDRYRAQLENVLAQAQQIATK